MAVDRTPVLKRCRALDIDPIVMGINKKSNRQPKRQRRQESEYGRQLREKQKAKFIYGVLEKQFHMYYEKALKIEGITGDNLMTILESRLDNVVFRLGFARTRKEARQTVRHGHITVNGKKTNIASYSCRPGDVIAVGGKASSQQLVTRSLDLTQATVVPDWLECDRDKLTGKIARVPSKEEIAPIVNEQLIVEFYSR